MGLGCRWKRSGTDYRVKNCQHYGARIQAGWVFREILSRSARSGWGIEERDYLAFCGFGWAILSLKVVKSKGLNVGLSAL